MLDNVASLMKCAESDAGSELHLVDVSLVDALLDVGQAAHVQRRVRQGGVHPRKAEDRQESRHHGHDEQIPVIGRTFFQPESTASW